MATGANFQTDDTGVTVYLKDVDGLALLCAGTVADTTLDTTLTYAKNCLYIKTDVATGTSGLYSNKGDSTTPVWSLITQA